jgi:hypothetical protein
MNWICFADRWPTVNEVEGKIVIATLYHDRSAKYYNEILISKSGHIGYFEEGDCCNGEEFKFLKDEFREESWCSNQSKSFWIALGKPEIK